MKRNTIKLGLVLLICWMISSQGISLAQQGQITKIHDGAGLVNVTWRVDSRVLYFLDSEAASAAHDNASEIWQEYTPQTGEVSQLTGAPLVLGLPNASTYSFFTPPSSPFSNTQASVYPSLNNRYIVYPILPYKIPSWYIGIADTQQQKTVATNAWIWNGFGALTLYKVLWNATNTVFVVFSSRDGYEPYHTFYVANFANDIAQVTTQELFTLTLLNRNYQILEPYDLSADGTTLIALVQDYTENMQFLPRNLMLWKPNAPNESRILPNLNAQFVRGAAFVPNDETKLLFVDENGLSEYDLTTNTITLLDGRIDQIWVQQQLSNEGYLRQALFSPDGRWLAMRLQGGHLGSHKLYVLPTGR